MLNLRLTQDSTVQELVARFNYLLHNRVRNSYSSWLNPCASARAAVVLSSTNVKFVHNWMENNESEYELATQLQTNSLNITANLNYWGDPATVWGTTDYNVIYRVLSTQRIFDLDERFSLAKIVYWPMIRTPDLNSIYVTSEIPVYRCCQVLR